MHGLLLSCLGRGREQIRLEAGVISVRHQALIDFVLFKLQNLKLAVHNYKG